MSVVPGSPKVTRCTSKPAALRIFSSTPSAPASAGVTEGQRTRSRAIERAERASVMPRLNTPHRRRASFVRHHFDFALLFPARPRVDRLQRAGAEPVGLSRSLQAIHFNEAPDHETKNDHSGHHQEVGIAEPVEKLVENPRTDEEGNHPPPAPVAVVQALDRRSE